MTARLLHAVLKAEINSTFHKLNVHSGKTLSSFSLLFPLHPSCPPLPPFLHPPSFPPLLPPLHPPSHPPLPPCVIIIFPCSSYTF